MKILILAAIPNGGLRLDQEIREIGEAIRRANKRHLFDIRTANAVRPQDIRRAIAEEKPEIVHFCGHGLEDGSLLLEDDGGHNKYVSPEGLAALFQLHMNYVNCVVLNACYSAKTAAAISKYINYTIGMNQPVGDSIAIKFAQGFYDGLGYEIEENQDIFKRGFDEGLVAMKMENCSQGAIPILLQKVSGRKNSSPSTELRTFEFNVVTIRKDNKGEWITRRETTPRQNQCFTQQLSDGIELEMVKIPRGTFKMGSLTTEEGSDDSERPQHQVTVPSFFMGKYPITQAQWRTLARIVHLQVNRHLDPDPSYFKGDNLPVERVSWYDAVEFCDRLSQYTGKQYRLPSEAEWEYACRAGTRTPFHFGETITTDLANYNDNYGSTTDVGSFPPNAFGLYDMHGNVWEWCLDDWHSNYKGAPTDGSPWFDKNDNLYQKSGLAVLRGGSWIFNPDYCRSACRLNDFAGRDNIYYYVGFRVVCAFGRTLQ
ncbi:MAG: SUMF1/EgtB/PvdO family nonheme iron enzyme [Calothrix sp. MO_167.B42]|nr:SUMF1/EgtB/PvdO family nonheme iron enzyme [Calothrix sp. MO_167.B42]